MVSFKLVCGADGEVVICSSEGEVDVCGNEGEVVDCGADGEVDVGGAKGEVVVVVCGTKGGVVVGGTEGEVVVVFCGCGGESIDLFAEESYTPLVVTTVGLEIACLLRVVISSAKDWDVRRLVSVASLMGARQNWHYHSLAGRESKGGHVHRK